MCGAVSSSSSSAVGVRRQRRQPGGSSATEDTQQRSGRTATVVFQRSGRRAIVVSQRSGRRATVVFQRSGRTATVVFQRSGCRATVVFQRSGRGATLIVRQRQQAGRSGTVLRRQRRPGRSRETLIVCRRGQHVACRRRPAVDGVPLRSPGHHRRHLRRSLAPLGCHRPPVALLSLSPIGQRRRVAVLQLNRLLVGRSNQVATSVSETGCRVHESTFLWPVVHPLRDLRRSLASLGRS